MSDQIAEQEKADDWKCGGGDDDPRRVGSDFAVRENRLFSKRKRLIQPCIHWRLITLEIMLMSHKDPQRSTLMEYAKSLGIEYEMWSEEMLDILDHTDKKARKTMARISGQKRTFKASGPVVIEIVEN